MAERKRRNTVVPKRLQDNGLTKQQIRGVTIPTSTKCLILLSNHDEVWVLAEKLQTELGDPLSKDNLVVGVNVIYQYRGKPYKAEILEVKPSGYERAVEGNRVEKVPEAANTKQKRNISDDDGESESEQVPKTVAAKRKRKITIVDEDSDSELDAIPQRVIKSKFKGNEISDDEDKENHDWTTPKSTRGSSKRGCYFDGDELSYPTRKQGTVNRLVVSEDNDNYWQSTRPVPKTTAHIDCPMYIPDGSYGGKNVHDILETHTKLLNDLQKSMSKVLKHLKQFPLNVDAQRPLLAFHGAMRPSVKNEVPVDTEEDDKFITEDGVNLLSLPSEIPRQYALNVMDALFTLEEMGTHCFRQNSRTTKPGLDVKRVQLVEDCVKRKFGKDIFNEKAAVIRQGCNQKCLDKKRILAKQEHAS